MFELKKQTAECELWELEHRQAEKRIKHINSVLRTIVAINQVIVQEKDRDKLLKRICKHLTDIPGCYNAYILLLDESGLLSKTTKAGLGSDFLPMVEQLKRGVLTECAQKVLKHCSMVVTEDPLSICTECPFASLYNGRGAVTVRLEHKGTVYGLFSLSIDKDFLSDEEFQALLKEVASDIGFALRSIELDEERKRLEEERERSQAQRFHSKKTEAIASLSGGIAHAFNNILAVIYGNIDLLNIHLPDEVNVDKYVTSMKASAHRMSHLTDQLLAYARGGKYQPKNISLNEFVEETLPLMKQSIDPSIHIETDFHCDILNVEADFAQMQMMLSGLLNNSAEAIEGKGHIRIITKNEKITEDFAKNHPDLKPGFYSLLTIQDDGKGMDKETLDRIFDPFFTTKFQGRGLGMAAVYGIIKNHDGGILVDSELGKGTTVHIYLPALETPAKKPKEPKIEPIVINGTGTILVIEDEGMVMDVTRALLERLGYRVLGAKTGREAISIAKTFDTCIDVAILDIVLPDMNGMSLYPCIMEARPSLKVLVCSGYPIDGPAQKILDAGAQDFIQKPFTIEKISQKLKEVLKSN